MTIDALLTARETVLYLAQDIKDLRTNLLRMQLRGTPLTYDWIDSELAILEPDTDDLEAS